MTRVATIVGAFLIVAGIFIFALILQRKVQTLHQTIEVGVTVGCYAIGAAGHEVVGFGVGVAAELRQHIGPAFHVVQYAIVTTVIEGAVVTHFDTGEGQTRPGLVIRPFGVIGLNVVFPLCVASHHVVDLGFAFKAQTHVGLIPVSAFIVGEIVQTIYLSVQI